MGGDEVKEELLCDVSGDKRRSSLRADFIVCWIPPTSVLSLMEDLSGSVLRN